MRALGLAAILFLLPGCLLAAGAAVGAGVVYATGEDTAEVRVEVNPAAAYAATREEVAARGTIETSDPEAGLLTATIGSSSVKVVVRGEADPARSWVSVKARTAAGLAPDMETARILTVAVVKRTR